MATVPTGGERYFAGPPDQAGIQVPHFVLDRAAAISPLRRGTAARLAAEPVRLGPPPRGCRPSTRAEMVLSPCCRLAFSGHSRSGQAHTPNFDRLWGNCPNALLQASGKDVGLPPGQMALF